MPFPFPAMSLDEIAVPTLAGSDPVSAMCLCVRPISLSQAQGKSRYSCAMPKTLNKLCRGGGEGVLERGAVFVRLWCAECGLRVQGLEARRGDISKEGLPLGPLAVVRIDQAAYSSVLRSISNAFPNSKNDITVETRTGSSTASNSAMTFSFSDWREVAIIWALTAIAGAVALGIILTTAKTGCRRPTPAMPVSRTSAPRARTRPRRRPRAERRRAKPEPRCLALRPRRAVDGLGHVVVHVVDALVHLERQGGLLLGLGAVGRRVAAHLGRAEAADLGRLVRRL